MLKRKGIALLATVLTASLIFGGCSSSNNTANNEENKEPEKQTEDTTKNEEKPAEKKKIKFYGKIVEYSSGEAMVEGTQEELKDKYDIEGLQVDWGNLEKVIKTGIASGEPADVYVYWPQAMKKFVEANQALDLTPYLEANNGEWKNTFNQSLLDIGKYDGKYYNVPLDSNYSTIYVNKDLFKQAGIEVPTSWSWDEFMTACKTINEKTGVAGFGIAKDPDVQSWLVRNGIMSLAKDDGKLEDLANGKVEATSPIFTKTLENIKALYDSKTWYPGEGALTVSRDEVKSAFYQGKVAMIAEVSASAKSIIDDAQGKFEVTTVEWPAMGKESVVLGGCDGLFIPANVSDPDAAVEVLKTFLDEKNQKIHADAGFAITNVNVEVSDPLTKSLIEASSNVYPKEFGGLNPKLDQFIQNEMIATYILGNGDTSVFDDLEAIRQQVVK